MLGHNILIVSFYCAATWRHTCKLGHYISVHESSLGAALELSKPIFPQPVLALFQYVLHFTYFVYQGRFSQQLEGVVMGSLLLLVIADFYIEQFEKIVLQTAPYKRSL